MIDNLALVVTHGMLFLVLLRLLKVKDPDVAPPSRRPTRQEPRRRA